MAAVGIPSPISMQDIQSHDAVPNSIRTLEPVENGSTIDADKNVSTLTDDAGGISSMAATSEESHEADKTAATNGKELQI